MQKNDIKEYNKKLITAYDTVTRQGNPVLIIRTPSDSLKQHLNERNIGGTENIVLKSAMPWVIPRGLFYTAFDNIDGHTFLEKNFPKEEKSGVTFYENLPLKPYVRGDKTTSKIGFDRWFNTADGSAAIESATHKILSNPDLKRTWIAEQEKSINNNPSKKQHIDKSFLQDHFLEQMHELEILRTDDTVDLFEYPTAEAIKKFVQNKDIISVKPSPILREYINTVNRICDNIEQRITDGNTGNLGNIFTVLRNKTKIFKHKKFLTSSETEFIKKFEDVVFDKITKVVNYVFEKSYTLKPIKPNRNNGLLIQDRRENIPQEWHIDKAGDVSVVFVLRSQEPTSYIPHDKRSLVLNNNNKIVASQCTKFAQTDNPKDEFIIFPQENASEHLGNGYNGLIHASPNDPKEFRFVFSIDFIHDTNCSH